MSSKTSLSLSSKAVTYGDESSIVFTADVTGLVVTPTGTVTVATGSTTLCTITLPAKTCSTTDNTALTASSSTYPTTATYSGDGVYDGSVSQPVDLLVDQASTSTSLSRSSSSATYGDESTVTFTSEVAPESSGTPTGTVTVATASTTLCTITLPATTCNAPDTVLDASPTLYRVVATYGGNDNFAGSTSSSSNLTVKPATTSTTLSLSTTSVTYGGESSLVFSASVTPQFGGTPTGTVIVGTGTTQLCRFTLPATHCSMPDTKLSPSSTPYPVSAAYGGDTNFTTSASGSHDLTVEEATTSTSLSLSSSSTSYGGESSITFTATVTPLVSGSPTGEVTVATGTTTLCTFDLPATTCTMPDTARRRRRLPTR